ncbi:SpoIIE family protein phosphatase [Nonomuraea sp. NPDC050663]|uniref:SpoIIE family protein phosphatase n=1 Tax=Nonomuraea sp. NPDC050663 TaxID=3364370 RepID=UPI00378979A6
MSDLILVVDDLEANRYVVSMWLQQAGYEVIVAATGREALDQVAQAGPDLVLLDISLPDMSGMSVCEQIKADPATAATPVVHLTATAVQVTDWAEGLARGADGYLIEPVEPEVLLATVNAMLRYARARRQAEQLAHMLAGLADTTLAVNLAGRVEDLLAAAAEGAGRIFGGPAAVFAGTRYATADPSAGEFAGDEVWSAPTGLTITVEQSGAWPMSLVTDQEQWVALSRPNAARPPVAVTVPVEAAPGEEHRHVLGQLAQAVSLAVEALRARDEERRIALTLQSALLPPELPVVPGLELCARYVPASREAEVGGDFYEVVELEDGLLVAIGDVMGHSVHAATVMGEIRHTLRAYALEGHTMSDVLRHVNRLLLRFHPKEVATVCLLSVDTMTGEVRAANAGHLPPLIVDASGRAEYHTLPGPLLGADLPRSGDVRLTIPPGGTLLLVTDGLVERRDMPLIDGLDRLQALAGQVSGTLDEVCDSILGELTGDEHEDDIALLVLRRAFPPASTRA